MFISSAYAQSGSQTQGGDPTFLLLMMVGLFVFMYFTTIRPQRKRQKEHSELINSLSQAMTPPRPCLSGNELEFSNLIARQ